MAPLSAVEIAKGTPRDAMKGVTQVTEGVFDTLPLEFLSKKTRATHSFVSFFLGTLVGNFCLLVFLAVVLVVSGTFSYMGVADCNVTDPRQMCQDYDGNDFWAAWWLSWGLHFDPGTQTGVPSDEGGPVKIVAVLFSVFGFVLNLIFLGLFVENVRSLLDSWRRTYGRIVANDHTVVLGWTDKTLFLLGELAEMMTDSEKGGGTIVVLGELEPLEMLLCAPTPRLPRPDHTQHPAPMRPALTRARPLHKTRARPCHSLTHFALGGHPPRTAGSSRSPFPTGTKSGARFACVATEGSRTRWTT